MKHSFYILWLWCVLAQAQPTLRWEGRIFSTQNNEKVSFALVSVYPTFKIFEADETGQITFEYLPTDSLRVSCLGYQTRVLTGKEAATMKDLRLYPAVVQLDEVTVRNKTTKAWWGNNAKRSNTSLSLMPGGKIALFIPNPTRQQGIVTKLRYYIANFIFEQEEGFRVPFRAQLYQADPQGKPSSPLLEDVLLVQSEKRRWFEVDISQYSISLPKEGVCVSMEFLSETEYKYQIKKMKVRQLDGSKKTEDRSIKVQVGMHKSQTNLLKTWVNFEGNWHLLQQDNTPSFMQDKEVMMGIEIVQ